VVRLQRLAASTLAGCAANYRREAAWSSGSWLLDVAPGICARWATIRLVVSLAILWRGSQLARWLALSAEGWCSGLASTLMIVTFRSRDSGGLARIAPPTIIGLGLACAVGAGLLVWPRSCRS